MATYRPQRETGLKKVGGFVRQESWVLFSAGFDKDPDPLAATFVVGTAIADDILDSL